MDNLNTHNEASLIKRFGEYEGRKLWARFTPHYTPKHGSWLNQAELVIHFYVRACLNGRRIASREELRKETDAFFRYLNTRSWKIDWKWTRKRSRQWVKTYRKKH